MHANKYQIENKIKGAHSEMINKKYCMSSYLALKYIKDNKMNFFDGMDHHNYIKVPESERIKVHTAYDIDEAIENQLQFYRDMKIGVFLSGGMDSAIVASYFRGADAYTFRYVGIDYPQDEIIRAEYFAKYYGLKLHYVDITWDSLVKDLDVLMRSKASPVYYIEPQIFQAALQAKSDGIDMVMVGEGSDLVFGGLSWLLAKDWTFDEFLNLYINLWPEEVIRDAESLQYIFERYRLDEDKINYLKFLDDIFATEAYTAYSNAFSVAGMSYFDPFEKLKMSSPLDIDRIRKGEPKYLIRELFTMKYPEIQIPGKIRMPNPMDTYLQNWKGPRRQEFIQNLDMGKFSGKHKWQLYCLERFLNLYDPQ